MNVMSARQLNQDVSAAKRAAQYEPLIITDRGRPAFVLMTMEAYDDLRNPSGRDICQRLAMDSYVDADFSPAVFQPQDPGF